MQNRNFKIFNWQIIEYTLAYFFYKKFDIKKIQSSFVSNYHQNIN